MKVSSKNNTGKWVAVAAALVALGLMGARFLDLRYLSRMEAYKDFALRTDLKESDLRVQTQLVNVEAKINTRLSILEDRLIDEIRLGRMSKKSSGGSE